MLKKSIEAFQKQLGTKLAFSMVPLSQVLAQNTLHYSISGNAAKAIFLSLSRQIGIGAGPFGFLWKVRDFIKKAVRKTGVAAAIVLLLLLLCGSVTATVLFKHGAFDFSGKYSGSADQAAAVVLTPAAARPTQNSPSTDSSQGSSSSTGSDNQSAGSNSGQESTSFDSTDISMRAETDVLSATVSPDHAKTPGSGTSDVPGPEASGTVTPTTEPTITPMVTPTIMPTLTVTPTLTPAPVIILPIVTPTPAPTDTPTATPTPTPTDTPTATPTPTPTGIEEQTAASVAAQIADIVSPLPGDVYLTLPSVPEGYSIAIQSSGNTGAIALDGKITLAGTEQTVTVVLMVTKSADNTTAETTGIDVVLPRMLRTNADLGITSTEGSTLSGVLIKEDTSISHQDGKTQANQTLLIVSIAAEDKTSAVLIPVTDHATVYAVAASNDAGAGGTKSGDYVPVDTNTFNVKSQHYLWIKVISEDLSTTRYYSLLVQ